jgi:hypothetical protein
VAGAQVIEEVSVGKANRARRAAKHRKRDARARAGRAAWNFGRRDGGADALLWAAIEAAVHGDEEAFRALVFCLADGAAPPVVAALVAGVAEQASGALWERGWQPADVARLARRDLSAPGAAFVVAAVGAQSRAYAAVGAAAAPWWMAQLADIGAAPPADGGGRDWALAWAAQTKLAWPEAVAAAVCALSFMIALPPIPEVAPPPRAWRLGQADPAARQAPTRADVDARVLARVRALLAKAESTEFEEEAAAFTAKAQELIARHRIDRVLLEDESTGASPVRARRIGIDDPYATPKAVLLHVVARANGCRSVWSKELGFATVFGEPADSETVELLFTSLLVQATTAMRVAAAGARAGARTRSRSFRQSFLVGYAHRIRVRLAEGVAAATEAATAEVGDRFLPVLARREREVDEAVRSVFGDLVRHGVGVNDPSGYAAGVAAADLADLTTGQDALAAS